MALGKKAIKPKPVPVPSISMAKLPKKETDMISVSMFAFGRGLHLLKSPGKTKVCPVVKSIPFKVNWENNT